MKSLEQIKSDNALKGKDILAFCKKMGQSQGSYGRLYQWLMDNPDALEYLESKKFGDYLDFVMFIEG